jgi:hypothetical protein
MTQITYPPESFGAEAPYVPDYAPAGAAYSAGAIPFIDPPQRSIWQPILMMLPVLFAVGGYLAGSTALSDVAFLMLAIFFAFFLLADLRRFSERFGIGGVVLFGGVLIWFCYDYFSRWFGLWARRWNAPIPEEIVAKSAMYHMIYITCMVIGIRMNSGRWFSKLLNKLPEPPSPSNYFYIVLLTQLIGLSPYVFFTREPFYLAMFHQITGGRSGQGTQWIAGRTGNVNFNWAAYIAQMLEVGEGGAVLASFCIVFLRQNLFQNVFCVCIWLLWLAMGFGTGTRGEIVLFMVPLCCFIFIRYHVQAQEFLQKYSVRAYLMVLLVGLFAIALVQTQIRYRNSGFGAVSLSDISLTSIEGNSMFSEGLTGFLYIPDRHDYFYNNFPGETIIMPIPNYLFWAAVAPMPRALWRTKPIDPSWEWYNAVYTGRSTLGGGTTEGTTISQGIVGYWFFRFGLAGVIEGGIFMGWVMGRIERAVYNNGGRPLAMFAALALLTWMFRTYRDADLQDLANTVVVLAAFSCCTLAARPFFRSHQAMAA